MLLPAGERRTKDVSVKKFQGSLDAGNRVKQRSIEDDNSGRWPSHSLIAGTRPLRRQTGTLV